MNNKQEITTHDHECNKKFAAVLNALPRAEMMVMITRISQGCIVPRHTVMNWKYGAARIPALAQHKIEEIIGESIFN